MSVSKCLARRRVGRNIILIHLFYLGKFIDLDSSLPKLDRALWFLFLGLVSLISCRSDTPPLALSTLHW